MKLGKWRAQEVEIPGARDVSRGKLKALSGACPGDRPHVQHVRDIGAEPK